MADWSEIVKQHGGLVWQTAYRLLRHDADAADCFQNTFLAALELSRREAVRHWPALLKRLATRQALNRLRQRRWEEHRARPLAGDGGPSHGVTPEQTARASELAEGLLLALADLEPRQAEVFWLGCLDGRSYQEIAEELGITVNHVGVLMNRARAALRERLRGFDPARPPQPASGDQP
jgi:RNA polymerase sigma-70 factor (ECF subfamily)